MAHDLIQWMTILQAVSTARLEIHRLRQSFDEVMTQTKQNPEVAEGVFAEVGDTLMGLPERIQTIEGALDRASLLVVSDLEGLLRAGMPISDLNMIEETGKRASRVPQIRNAIVWGGGRFAGILSCFGSPPGRIPKGILRGLCGSVPADLVPTHRYRMPGSSRIARYFLVGKLA